MPYLLLQCLVSDFSRFGKCLHSPVTTIHYKLINLVTISPWAGLGDWPISGITYFTWPKMGQSIPDCDQCPPDKVFAPVLHKNVVLILSPSWISPHFLILQLCKGLAARCVLSWPTTFPHSGYFISASELSSVFAWPLSLLLYIHLGVCGTL